jgi:hypothetical protein
LFNVRLPVLTIFILFLGAISTAYVLLSIPFRALTLILKGLKKKKS